jgi:flagellar basal body-associated protein FliL
MTATDSISKPSKPKGRKRKVIIILGVMFLLVVSAGATFYWWQNRPINPVILNADEQRSLDKKVESVQERTYEPGTKVITLTEREVNALFHHNTGLGDKVQFELASNAVHARIRTELDKDLPIVGGRTLKAKARFLLTDTKNTPALILDDLTVWGISLPNAWLAEIKGQNMLANIGLDMSNSQIAAGIKNISVDHGKITIQLAE